MALAVVMLAGLGQLRQILPRTEGASASADDDHGDVGIVGRGPQRIADRVVEIVVESVEHVRPVEGEAPDAAVVFDAQDRGVLCGRHDPVRSRSRTRSG